MKYLIVLLCAMAVSLPGCLAMNPGGQVEKALKQSKIYEWRETGTFWAEAVGTHEEEFTMAEGNIVMKEDDEGNMVVDFEKSRLTHYLHAKPNAGAAASAAGLAFEASTQQVKAMSASFDKMVALIASTMAPVPKPPPAAAVPSPFAGPVGDLLPLLVPP